MHDKPELPAPYIRVRERLKSLRISQHELARRLDVSQANISKTLRGQNDTFLIAIVDYLKDVHGDNPADYLQSSTEMIGSQLRNEIPEMLGKINAQINKFNELIQAVQEEQTKTREEINDIKKFIKDKIKQ